MLLDDEVGPNSCQCLQLEGDNTGKELEDCVANNCRCLQWEGVGLGGRHYREGVANNGERHVYGKKEGVHVVSLGI